MKSSEQFQFDDSSERLSDCMSFEPGKDSLGFVVCEAPLLRSTKRNVPYAWL